MLERHRQARGVLAESPRLEDNAWQTSGEAAVSTAGASRGDKRADPESKDPGGGSPGLSIRAGVGGQPGLGFGAIVPVRPVSTLARHGVPSIGRR